MKVSLNTVTSLLDFELPPVGELVQRINAQLGGVENIIELEDKYRDVKIVRVIECQKHPNADRLSVCKIDAGTGELVQVVCGAPNVRDNMWAVWLPPESVVPSTYGTSEPFTLSARELRGVMSNGMLAAGDELGINNDHDGIIEITERDIRGDVKLNAGASFAKLFGLDDTIIEIENKMFTHRPDLFGQVGVAREIAGIYAQPFKDPEWYWQLPVFEDKSNLKLEVFNDCPDKVPRFMAVAMSDVAIRPSPLWLQCALVAMGLKSISNVVDITNYIMLMTAQPTHAYDYDKLQGKMLGARTASPGETLALLNGKTYQLNEDDIVIADESGPIGLAGIMGGSATEVSESTKNIVLEVANFNMYSVRKSSMRHGLFTDAVTRFNKGQSPLQNDRVTATLMSFMTQYADASQASPVVDLRDGATSMYDTQSVNESLTISTDFINMRLGLNLSGDDIEQLLRNVHFACLQENEGIRVTAPFWRTDIELAEDIVEEVGRLYGFEKLPRTLPQRSAEPASMTASRRLKSDIRQTLSRLGANEVLTYSFVHERTITHAQQDPSHAYKLSNALSPDLQYYRLSVLPSLLEKVYPNIKAGHEQFTLFEIGKAHQKTLKNNESIPSETELLDMVLASKESRSGAAYFTIRRQVSELLRVIGVEHTVQKIETRPEYAWAQPFDIKRSSLLKSTDGNIIGIIGEFSEEVRRSFKLPLYAAGASIHTDSLLRLCTKNAEYRPLSRYPSVIQDISLKVSIDCEYSQVLQAVISSLSSLDAGYVVTTAVRSIYQPENSQFKTITFRISIANHERTLSDDDVRPIMQAVATAATNRCGAEVV